MDSTDYDLKDSPDYYEGQSRGWDLESSDNDLKAPSGNTKPKPYVSANTVASPVDVCVTKVSEVCFPSQRIEKSTVQKEFCWVRP